MTSQVDEQGQIVRLDSVDYVVLEHSQVLLLPFQVLGRLVEIFTILLLL